LQNLLAFKRYKFRLPEIAVTAPQLIASHGHIRPLNWRFPMVTQRETDRTQRDGMAQKMANGLGWFSIGLGVAELLAPKQMEKLIGVRDRDWRRNILRTYGLREITAGVGILAKPDAPGWLWTRVAGDIVDLATLGRAMNTNQVNRARVARATAAVIGVTALDVLCGAQLSRTEPFCAATSVLVQGSTEDLYNFWRNLSNVTALEPALESVRPLGDQHWRWQVKLPAGRALEFDTETIEDQPNRRIAWRSTEGSPVKLQVTIDFKPATANHGTMVRAELQMKGSIAMLAKPAHAAGLGPELRLEQHLRRFKQLMEAGEIARAYPGQATQPVPRPEPMRPAMRSTTREQQPEPAMVH
jgi:uncharacterized membrane protein